MYIYHSHTHTQRIPSNKMCVCVLVKLGVLFHRRSGKPMKPICGRDWEQQLPAADLADSMELAQSRLCFFILQLPSNMKTTSRYRSSRRRGPIAETLSFAATHLFPSVRAAEQLLFQENPLEVTRAVNNFAQFALNWPKRTEPGAKTRHAYENWIFAETDARRLEGAGICFCF